MDVQDSLHLQKQSLRRRMRALRDAIPAAQREIWSRAICERAKALPAFHTARTIHVYLPIGSEVDTTALVRAALKMDKQVVVPIVELGSEETPCALIDTLDESAFTRDRLGLRTPRVIRTLNLREVEAIFVPLLAFGLPADGREGIARLGQGGGYYDRLLARLPSHTAKVGLAFECQRVPTLPVGPHDMLLDHVITDVA